MLTGFGTQVFANAIAEEFSQAVSMIGANAISVGLSILSIAALTQVDVYVQESNDLENWEDVGSFTLTRASVGYREATATGLSMAHVRLRYEVDTDGGAVFSIKANTAKL